MLPAAAGKGKKRSRTKSHKRYIHTGFAALFADNVMIMLPAVIIMYDDGVEIQRLHTPQKTPQFIRRVPQK